MPQHMLDTFLDSIASPALKAVASHWLAARGDRLMPSWQQIKPSQIAPHLPILWAYRYDRDTGQFTGRLAGDRITQGMGKSFRGVPLEKVHSGGALSWARERLMRGVGEPACYLSQGMLFRQAERIGRGERIGLPLADDGVHGDGILGASDHDYALLNPHYAPIEFLNEGERWFSLSLAA